MKKARQNLSVFAAPRYSVHNYFSTTTQGDKYYTSVSLSHELHFMRYHKNAEVIFDAGHDMNVIQILNIQRDT
jgi:hypothetical protein